MLAAEISITIPGHPAPKGSMKCVGARGRVRHQLVEDNPRSQPWRDEIARWGRLKLVDRRAIGGQPIGAEVSFTIDRPKYHTGTGRNALIVKPRYVHTYPVGQDTGDVDKLLRLVLDALQDAEVLPDDCQVVEATTRKAYTVPPGESGPVDALGYPGVVIRLYPIEERT